MLIPLDTLTAKYGFHPMKVIHAGGHLAEEADAYEKAGAKKVLWVEANPALIGPLYQKVASRTRAEHWIEMGCLGSSVGLEVSFNVANNSQSSSVLPLGTHKERHPDVAYVGVQKHRTVTLNQIAEKHEMLDADLIEYDLQGAELDALRGSTYILPNAKMVYLEVNIEPLYEGCGLLPEIDKFLNSYGLECVELDTCGCRWKDCSDGRNRWVGWGDAAYLRVDNPRPYSEIFPKDWANWYGNS